jgi:hypothetical protein
MVRILDVSALGNAGADPRVSFGNSSPPKAGNRKTIAEASENSSDR